MSRWVNEGSYSSFFGYFSECNRQDVVLDVATPTNLSNSLSHVTMVSGDFSIEDGTEGGKKLEIGAKLGVDVTAPGTTRHTVLSKDGVIRLVTPCNEREVSAALEDKINMGGYYIEVGGPEDPEV